MAEEETQPQDQEIETTLVVKNKLGIHARPAAMIVRAANKYRADIYVEKDGEQVNGKSIMGLMMLAAAQGTELKFVAVGEGGDQLLNDLKDLFERKFENS